MTTTENVAGYEDILTGSHDTPAEADGTVPVDAASSPELRSLLGVVIAVVVISALYFGKDVLLPITLAVMLSFVLSPLVNLLQRLGLWRAPAVMLTVLAALGVLGVIGTLIGSQAAALTANAPQYAQTIEAKVQGVHSYAIDKLAAVTEKIGGDRLSGRAPAGPAPTPAPAPSLQTNAPKPVPVQVVQGQTSPFTIARTILQPILSPLETTVLVLIVAIFVLMQREDLRDRFIRLFGSNDLHRTTRAMDDAGQRLSKYFIAQLAVNTCFGLVICGGLWVIGVPSPLMWGLLAGMLRFVPYIGSLLAAIAPAALGAAVDPGWAMAIEVVALFLVVEPVTGYAIEPMLYGHSTGLSPVSVIVSAIFWTWLWGPIGLIMSTPLTLCLVVLGRHVKSLEFFDVILGDRPALTPVETFYQRILANNPDEALAEAEAHLADQPLVTYYDDVLLPALKLAVEDQARGTLDRARVAKMTQSMMAVIDDLDDHADAREGRAAAGQSTPVVQGSRVLCIAGGGPFDDLVSAMLRQLLANKGLDARMITNDRVSREAAPNLDFSGVETVFVSYLEVSEPAAPLRYLIKRLRRNAPDLKIIVGLWPAGEAILSNPEAQRSLGASAYVGSLKEAIGALETASARSDDADATRAAPVLQAR